MRRGKEKPVYVWDTGKGLEIEMVCVPPGEFLMTPEKLRTPMAQGFYIGRCETTWKEYLHFCATTGHERPPAPGWGIHDDHSVVNVAAVDADAFCEWARLALPSTEQWEKAARGTDGREYPWGNDDPRFFGASAPSAPAVLSRRHARRCEE